MFGPQPTHKLDMFCIFKNLQSISTYLGPDYQWFCSTLKICQTILKKLVYNNVTYILGLIHIGLDCR